MHWACQFAGIIITPLNWRSTADELDYLPRRMPRPRRSSTKRRRRRGRAGFAGGAGAIRASRSGAAAGDTRRSTTLVARRAGDARPRADAEAWSVMLYTSGTTARPKGVPRRQRAERAAALAHVAQNLYRAGERTLGVMPLYHTMGVRSLLAMSLIGGAFVCLPRFDVGARAGADRGRADHQSLSGADALSRPACITSASRRPTCRSVRKLGFAGALDDRRPAQGARGGVQARAVRQSLRLVGDLHLHHRPERAGEARLRRPRRHQPDGARGAARRRARRTRSRSAGEEGEIIALLAGDESFEGYWRRPDADAKALRDGWYFTGDTGYFDADGDLFVTGRVDDMIITGGENVSPVEIESCLSLHPAVSEVAVVGLPDERWGKIVAAFVKRSAAGRRRTSSTSSAAPRGSPTSSGRAAMCSSRRSRNRRSASCCAASWWRANTSRSERRRRAQQGTAA